MEINWDEVVSEKTILVWDAGHGFQDTEFHIIHTFGDSVWYRTNRFGVPLTTHKSHFKNCHIKDQWREITEECEVLIEIDRNHHQCLVIKYKHHNLKALDLFGYNYKLEGMRVFTCA